MPVSLSSFNQSGSSFPHDLHLTPDGDLSLVRGREEQRQRLFVHLLTSRGDWFYDQNYGVPYRDIMEERGRFSEKVNRLEQDIFRLGFVSEMRSESRYDATTRTLYVHIRARGEN